MRRTPSRTSRHPRVTRALLVVLLGMVLAGCSGAQTMLDPQGPYAEDPNNLFLAVLMVAAVVFVFVQGLIIFTSWRYRRQEDDDAIPEQVHGNTKLEIVWTLIPLLILIGIAVPTVRQVLALAEEPDGALVVEVIGHRWWWEYRYPDSGIITANELVIPVDRPIRLEMRAEESGSDERGVLHSFWVPALAGKQDVIPGRVATLNMQADTAGRYPGQCAEYCGLSHANMRNRAVAMEPADFDAWVAEQQQPSEVAAAFAGLSADDLQAQAVPPGVDDEVARGYYLYTANCVACHGQMLTEPVASAEDFVANQGPNLTHLLSRREFAGAIYDLYAREDPDDPNSLFTDQVNVDLLTEWVTNAPSMKAMTPEDGVGMPSFEQGTDNTGGTVGGLPGDDLDAIVAYLLTME